MIDWSDVVFPSDGMAALEAARKQAIEALMEEFANYTRHRWGARVFSPKQEKDIARLRLAVIHGENGGAHD